MGSYWTPRALESWKDFLSQRVTKSNLHLREMTAGLEVEAFVGEVKITNAHLKMKHRSVVQDEAVKTGNNEAGEEGIHRFW